MEGEKKSVFCLSRRAHIFTFVFVLHGLRPPIYFLHSISFFVFVFVFVYMYMIVVTLHFFVTQTVIFRFFLFFSLSKQVEDQGTRSFKPYKCTQ